MVLKRIRVTALILCICMVAAVFTGCGGNSSTASGGKDGTDTGDSKSKEINVALISEYGLDVHQVTAFDADVCTLFENLVTFSADRKKLVPLAAESVNVSEDGKVITIKLPAGMTFTNGDPLDAKAVKASFERMRKLSPTAKQYEVISKIEAADSQTVVFTCSAPSGALLSSLTSGEMFVLNAAVAEKVGNEAFQNNPIGYGPTYIKEWSKGNYLILARNDKYKTNNPYVQNKGPFKFNTIKFRYISNNFTRINELTAGNIDVIMSVPSESLESLKNNKDINIINYESKTLQYVFVNPDRISDVRVRAAVKLATNRDQLKTALQDRLIPVYGLLAPLWIGFSKEAEEQNKKDYAYNSDKARALLAEAGYKDTNGDGIVEKNGKPLEMDCYFVSSGDFKTAATVLQAQYMDIGIKLNLKEGDAASTTQARKSRVYDLLFAQAGSSDASILDLATQVFELMKGSTDKEKCEKLLAEAGSIVDIPQRAAKYAEAVKIMQNYSTVISLGTSNSYIAYRKNIKGLKISEDGNLYWNDVTKE